MSYRMRVQFGVDVGDIERHRVEFSYEKMFGRLRISVDGVPLRTELHLFVLSTRLVDRYRFTVGANERHDVEIEKRRKLFLAGFRRQTFTTFVDGRPVHRVTA